MYVQLAIIPLPDETTHRPTSNHRLSRFLRPSLPCLPRPPLPPPVFPPRMLPSFLPSPFRVPIALPPKIERRRRRNSQLIAERGQRSSGPLHLHVEYRRPTHRRRSHTLPAAASVVAAAEIHSLIWLMSERECGMNLDDAGFPRGILSIHHSAIRSIHLFREGFRRWRSNIYSFKEVAMWIMS